MKKTLLTLVIVLLTVAAQAQIAFKVHNNGQISLQSATTSYGVQIPSNGVASFEPNVTVSYGKTTKTKMFNVLAKAWSVFNYSYINLDSDVFYVLGNGNVFSYGQYTIDPSVPGVGGERGSYPIEHASELITDMKGYYLDSDEFEGVTPEDIENSEYVNPDALEGLLRDMEKGRTAGMVAEELEEILPEAVRHDPDGLVGINYNAVVTVLVEAFKEQQARIDQLESILRENNLLK